MTIQHPHHGRSGTILLCKRPHGGRATAGQQPWLLRSHLELAALPGAVPRARHHARRVLADWDLGGLGDQAELVVSELVTNAIRAWPAARVHRQVRLRLASDRARVLIEVQDGSPQPPVPAAATAEDESGRGLCLVEAMSAAWNWYPHWASGGKVVWALVPAAYLLPATDSSSQQGRAFTASPISSSRIRTASKTRPSDRPPRCKWERITSIAAWMSASRSVERRFLRRRVGFQSLDRVQVGDDGLGDLSAASRALPGRQQGS